MIFNISGKDKKKNEKQIDLVKIVSLLIHAAKIDEDYSEHEKEIIIEFLISYSSQEKKNDPIMGSLTKENAILILKEAEEYEKNSNQILEYTKEIKKIDENFKIAILKALWKVILSDNKSDIYENSLMRRICGLLYISDKLSGEIKLDILKRKKI